MPLEHAVAQPLNRERAQRTVFGEGFHTVALPQMAERNAFQDHTATGKLNAEMTPTTPSGCHCSYMRCWPRSECIVRAVEHARLTDGKIRDVDHLLHLAVAFRLDLAVSQGHETAERVLVDPQLVGQRPHRFAALWRGCARRLERGLDRGKSTRS